MNWTGYLRVGHKLPSLIINLDPFAPPPNNSLCIGWAVGFHSTKPCYTCLLFDFGSFLLHALSVDVALAAILCFFSLCSLKRTWFHFPFIRTVWALWASALNWILGPLILIFLFPSNLTKGHLWVFTLLLRHLGFY